MKLLENPKLEAMSHKLQIDKPDCRFEGRLESYSCKMVTKDKRLFKLMSNEMGLSPNDLQALSPPVNMFSSSPTSRFGSKSFDMEPVLCDAISLKTLFYLISTLNESFHPDYDFSQAKSDEFSKESSLASVVNSVDCRLLTVLGDDYNELSKELWATIDEEICLRECSYYSYNPDLTSDPYEDSLWFFNYFFYNKKLKRILFFTCMAKSMFGAGQGDSGVDMYGGDEEDYQFSVDP
ncbi:hypothetical protein HELRODRAFT_166724 [Helobdella robusta]|uniref:Repressor of RNA polymerase III transcription MAF1 n=1 Tax=Helobdella robusta TaxID=6412 RepID=T1EYF7_HELRO|nr:hypothetical protein HELRODRAFT_166724 [Helobdella robusta]ESO11707.1 hypothetical protein HELRODRAFT_166724 [Helobdella robusta]